MSRQQRTRSLIHRPSSIRDTWVVSTILLPADRFAGRRRKKSCVPRPATPGTCEECFARGVQCRKQEVSIGAKRRAQVGTHDLQQRVTELETALSTISQKLDTPLATTAPDNGAENVLQHSRLGVLPSKPATPTESNSETLLKHAPVLSLFDNALLSRQPDDSTSDDFHSIRSPGPEINKSTLKLGNIRRTLLSLFPSKQNQEALLNASYKWWSGWQDVYPQIFTHRPYSNVVEFIADLKGSNSVQNVTKALLCLLIMMQERSHSLNTSHELREAASDNTHTLAIINETVLNDDELAGTLDGVECMILRSKYELNTGRIRKAWLTFRRGISLAQLSGLHKRPMNPLDDPNLTRRRDSLWKALYSGDRFLSLMLGVPYGPSEVHSDIGRDSEACAKGIRAQDTGIHYYHRLANVVGCIIDRNQQLPSNNMLPLTLKIEAEMMELAGSMTSDWWESGHESIAAADRMYDQLMPQFWHHQARSLLHLPYMLKAATDRRFEYNKIAAVESAREMVVRYRVMRPALGFGSLICKMIDFQVFTAAMILVLNLLDHYRKSEIFDRSEADKDQDLISATADILQRASVETDGGVATQAARALEHFGNIKEINLPIGRSQGSCIAKVVIPYFGTVVFGPGTSLRDRAQMQKPDSGLQPQQLPTPSDQSVDCSTPESAPSSNTLIEPIVPFDFNYDENSGDTSANGDLFANIDFDLDQDWSWFWNNTDIPSVDTQGLVG